MRGWGRKSRSWRDKCGRWSFCVRVFELVRILEGERIVYVLNYFRVSTIEGTHFWRRVFAWGLVSLEKDGNGIVHMWI